MVFEFLIWTHLGITWKRDNKQKWLYECDLLTIGTYSISVYSVCPGWG